MDVARVPPKSIEDELAAELATTPQRAAPVKRLAYDLREVGFANVTVQSSTAAFLPQMEGLANEEARKNTERAQKALALARDAAAKGDSATAAAVKEMAQREKTIAALKKSSEAWRADAADLDFCTLVCHDL